MSRHPCPFENRCSLADENCSEEKSITCDVIHNTTPPPPKLWNPQEPVAVTLTREQWENVKAWLAYGADWYHLRMVWWRDSCADRQYGTQKAKEYEAAVLQAEIIHEIIEETLTAE